MDKDLSTIEQEIQARKQAENLPTTTTQKSIAQVSVDDIQLTLDKTRSMEQQAEDIVGAMATARAVQDEDTAQSLADKKAAELKARAKAKVKQAEAAETQATTDKEEAQRQRYEAVLQTFCIKTHLPKLLMYVMLVIFSPIYIAISIAIGVPCGIVKVIIDNIDNILVRYENADEKNKPKIKFTVLFLLIAGAVAAVGYVVYLVLKKYGII